MKRIIIPVVIALCSIAVVNAQQTARFSNYLFNPLALNPAAAGSYDYMNVMGIYRTQWVGIEGAPKTAVLSIDAPIKERKVGLGLQYVNEKIGALTQNAIVPAFAYRLRTGSYSWLSAGIGVGIFRNTVNGPDLNFKDASDQAIPTSREGVTYVDVNTGLYYNSEHLVAGLSVLNLLKPHISYTGGQRAEEGGIRRSYQFYGGFLLPVGEGLSFQPSVLFRSSQSISTIQTDIAGMLFIRAKAAIGLSYRNAESINILADYWINADFRLGYAFDITTSKIANYVTGSHEIMLAYRIFPSKNLMLNPRSFYNK